MTLSLPLVFFYLFSVNPLLDYPAKYFLWSRFIDFLCFFILLASSSIPLLFLLGPFSHTKGTFDQTRLHSPFCRATFSGAVGSFMEKRSASDVFFNSSRFVNGGLVLSGQKRWVFFFPFPAGSMIRPEPLPIALPPSHINDLFLLLRCRRRPGPVLFFSFICSDIPPFSHD